MNILVFFKHARSFLLTKLNFIGSILLAYALANPTAASEMMNLLPPQLKTPVALAIPVLWFALVQYAKAKMIAREQAKASGAAE